MTVARVAERAGVSVATVSRVINNDPRVKPATVSAVRAAIDCVGYTPPPARKRRRSGSRRSFGVRTGRVAILFPDVSAACMRTPLSVRLLSGMEQALHEHDLTLVPVHLRADGRLPLCLQRFEVDGVIARQIREIAGGADVLRRLPTLSVFEPPTHVDWADLVEPDNTAIGALAARVLLDADCQHPLCVNFDRGHVSLRKREAALVAELSAAGVPVHCMTPDKGVPELVRRIHALPEVPDGVFLLVGDVGFEPSCRQLAEAGLDLTAFKRTVCCHHNSAHVARVAPGMANVELPVDWLGRAAVDALVWRMRCPESPQRTVLIGPKLVACPQVEKETVA